MAAINKNFVIKNGIEVGENLIYGDKANLKVGIGTTVPNYTLDVRGGIGATSISVGQTITANSGIFTSFNVSGVGTITTLNATGVTATVVSSTWSQVGLGLTFTTGIATNFTVSGVATVTTLNATGVAATAIRSTWSQVGAGLTFTTGIATNFTVSGVGTITTLNATGVAATAVSSTWSQVGAGLTFTTGIATNFTVSGVGTIANLSSGIATVTKIHVGIATTYSETLVVSGNARVTGILTIGTGSITLNGNTDIITVGTGATIFSSGDVRLAGIITAYKFVGDGSALTGTISGVGINSDGVTIGTGVTFINFAGPGVSTVTVSAGIATINFEGGGGSGTTIDKQTFNVGAAGTNLLTLSNSYTVGNIDVYINGIKLSPGDFSEPTGNTVGLTTAAVLNDVIDVVSFRGISNNLNAIGIQSGGVSIGNTFTTLNFIGAGNTFKDIGNGIVDISIKPPNDTFITNLSASGIATVTKIHVGIATTFSETLVVSGDARVTGIVTIGPASITLNGITNIINVGAGLTLDGSTGIISASQVFAGGVNLASVASGSITPTSIVVGSGVTINSSGINVTGVVTATSFVGSGANLTGISSVSFATTSFGLSGSPNITVGNIVGVALTLSGNITSTSIVVGSGVSVSGISTFNGNLILNQFANEKVNIVAGTANGNTNIDLVTNGSVHYFTSNSSATWTPNFRASSSVTLDSVMSIGQVVTAATISTQNNTSFYSSAINIDGSSRTIKWSGGTAPTAGSSSGVDMYTYSIVKTAADTFTVFASSTQFA